MGLTASILQQLNEIGIALSQEPRLEVLHETILQHAKELTGADGGTIYSVVEDKALRFEIVINDSLHFHLGGTSEKPLPFADIPLELEGGAPNVHHMVAYAVNHKQTINIEDAYDEVGFDFSGTRHFDAQTGYRTRAVLTVPMQNHEGEVIAVLQLINPTGVFSVEDVHLAESLASQAGVALNNQLLICDLRALFEGMVRVIAEAIDAESPYTAHHGQRVPIVAELLARAVGSFTEEELHALKVAAFLHDCGKITVPVHLMEKQTKLKGVFDRMEVVALRFENHTLKTGELLDEELSFVKRCNVGKEEIDAEAKARLEQLRARGLLTEEEVASLAVVKGNLSDEERKIVENHVVMSERLLSEIPFPKNLRKVPLIAGSHHERMDGKGYPRGLKGEEIPLEGRILAIADVFESLSAPDRPYRKSAHLSEILSVIQKMGEEGHLDPHLVEIFLKKKVYLQYALSYLQPEQIDVD